jgi:hypothetical protein
MQAASGIQAPDVPTFGSVAAALCLVIFPSSKLLSAKLLLTRFQNFERN